MPFLVLLPLIESSGGMEDATPTTLLQSLGPTALSSAAGLGVLLLSGRFVLRRVYEVRARAIVHDVPGSVCSGPRAAGVLPPLPLPSLTRACHPSCPHTPKHRWSRRRAPARLSWRCAC